MAVVLTGSGYGFMVYWLLFFTGSWINKTNGRAEGILAPVVFICQAAAWCPSCNFTYKQR